MLHPLLAFMRAGLVALGLCLASLPARGQLAITEVMSSATTFLGQVVVQQHPDFWELTNFGTNRIDLDEYRFYDNGGFTGADEFFFSGKHLDPGESMILVKTVTGVIETPEQFRAWWGDTNLPADLQIYFYSIPGFSSHAVDHDLVQLWRVTLTSTTLVDRVELAEAEAGSTFTYDPATGVFGVISEAGRQQAFKAVETDDIGSPGFATGPVPPIVLQQPQSQTVDGGGPVTFSIRYGGVPRPLNFQWFKDNVPIPGATSDSLTIQPALPADAGQYKVQLDNGVATVFSAPATLVVNTNPECARIVTPPEDLCVTSDDVFQQTASFSPSVRGYPLPVIQWQFNGTNIPNATNATLHVFNCTNGSAGAYTIRVANTLCTNTATAHLCVTRKPLLRVTEAMPAPSTNTAVPGHDDWWELTNVDTNAVNLRGYRFNDYPATFEGAFTNVADVILQPGESIIFVRNMSPQAFKEWWGEENLPQNLQIITYIGHNFHPETDVVRLWNATATDPLDYLARASFNSLDPNSPPGQFNVLYGVSKWFDPTLAPYGQFNVLGQRGAFRAVEADDIGSPGCICTTNHVARLYAPRITTVSRNASGARITWKARPNKIYELQGKTNLTDLNWTALNQQTTNGFFTLTAPDAGATNAARFYKLRVLP